MVTVHIYRDYCILKPLLKHNGASPKHEAIFAFRLTGVMVVYFFILKTIELSCMITLRMKMETNKTWLASMFNMGIDSKYMSPMVSVTWRTAGRAGGF